ncbi:aminoglycoside phosphotransferase family protein [Streptomyces sp. NBC_00102]|uniref:aminoglycoside phosphotransferase family protein n=1 Tax=Streptomyces sp. NBC_00102 TaxID=2975652 RepID=UPI00225A07F6|nr:aminoglycoside phosphotransferase family protein [Streptomyces sp. NBC_00102]MCX5397891.1 aminoglycoside phosphotransferase family protein [Streptomyces sp. NBC_00102]
MIDIPEELIATQTMFNGAAGRAFTDALPELAARYVREWGLRVDGPPMYGMCALVLPVVRDGSPGEDALGEGVPGGGVPGEGVPAGLPAALKLQLLDEESAGEALALRVWGEAGAGTVALLDHDPVTGAMLLERLDENRPLSALPDVHEAVGVLAQALARLVAVPAPRGLRTLADMAARMLAEAPRALPLLADDQERRLVADCAAALREVAGEPGDRLLHWDLHYDNVLAGRPGTERAHEWVALDPKPLAGDPGFELFPALDNRFDAADVLWRFDALSEALGPGYDRERARAWTLGRVLQNVLWRSRSGAHTLAPDHAEIARRLLGR